MLLEPENQAESKVSDVQKGPNNEDTCCLCNREICYKSATFCRHCHDVPEGRKLIESLAFMPGKYLLMDRAYEDSETRELALKLGLFPVVLPKKNRKFPWKYDTELYKRRNEVERFFLRIKRFRSVFTRYDKLDALYLFFVTVALICNVIFM